MKTLKVVVVLAIMAVVIGAVVITQHRKSPAQKMEQESKSTMESVEATVKKAANAVDQAATNVAVGVKTGVQKAGVVATNVVGEVKAEIHDATH